MHNNFNNQLKTKPDMRKKLYVLLALLAFCASAYAVDYTGMDVYSVSGEKLQELWFNHYSSITFDATTGEITFVGDGKVGENTGKVCSSISYGWGTVASVEYSTSITGIGKVSANAVKPFKQTGSELQFNMAAKVAIFGMDGRLATSMSVASGESVNISSLPTGIYAVKVNNATYKIAK
jgi:hypothetical protein